VAEGATALRIALAAKAAAVSGRVIDPENIDPSPDGS